MTAAIRPEASPVTLDEIEDAARTLKGAIVATPFAMSRTLSVLLGCEIWLKFENLQFTAAYKERGALNKLASLTSAERSAGVIAMSAGNHAQGVAYHAARLGIPATIVMPEGTPAVKVENTRALGARVILEGATFEDSARITRKLARDEGYTFIHPFDDPKVIAGQGTIALEMLHANPDLDDLVIPIGGGGLISGMGTVARALKPSLRVIGIEAALYPSMYNLIKHASLPIGGDTLAEGIAVKEPGALTRSMIANVVDDIMLVSEAEIERAVALLIGIEKTVVEGAGAAGLAAIIADPHRFRGRKVGLVLCGGNIDARLLASVLTRELARDGRLARLAIDIPDRPGQLAKVSGVIGSAGANIVEVYHQRLFHNVPVKMAEVDVVLETRDQSHVQALMVRMRDAGFPTALMTDVS